MQSGSFVQDEFRRAIHAAGRRENKPADTAAARHIHQHARGGAIHFRGQLLILFASLVAHDRGQMNHPVAPAHGLHYGADIAHVSAHQLAIRIFLGVLERPFAEKKGIEHAHLESAREQLLHHHRTQVASAAENQNVLHSFGANFLLHVVEPENSVLGQPDAAHGEQHEKPSEHGHTARSQRAAINKIVGENEKHDEEADRAKNHRSLANPSRFARAWIESAELKYQQREKRPKQPVLRDETLESLRQTLRIGNTQYHNVKQKPDGERGQQGKIHQENVHGHARKSVFPGIGAGFAAEKLPEQFGFRRLHAPWAFAFRFRFANPETRQTASQTFSTS